jgi:hypothetical protein
MVSLCLLLCLAAPSSVSQGFPFLVKVCRRPWIVRLISCCEGSTQMRENNLFIIFVREKEERLGWTRWYVHEWQVWKTVIIPSGIRRNRWVRILGFVQFLPHTADFAENLAKLGSKNQNRLDSVLGHCGFLEPYVRAWHLFVAHFLAVFYFYLFIWGKPQPHSNERVRKIKVVHITSLQIPT